MKVLAAPTEDDFDSLPPALRRKSHGGRCGSVILDAADEVLYRLDHQRQAGLSPRASPSEAMLMSSSSFIANSESSDDPVDSAVDMGESRESFYDSFRWLDEDGDLDLSLDDYHAHVVDTVPAPKKSPRRKPSFRRTLSFTSMYLGRNSTSNANQRVTRSSQSSNVPSSFGPQVNRFSTSRPASSNRVPRHVSHGSTSSIDPCAQYYQDPEARLKLRVYLASPQKFDEAIEFGFPSLDDKENVRPKRPLGEPRRRTHESARTFLDDGDNDDDDDDSPSIHETASQSGRDRSDETDDPGVPGTRKSSKPSRPLTTCVQGSGRNREMTLKMTLTRPDLRTMDTFTVSPGTKDLDDPLKLADLPPADEDCHPWDSSSGERGMMKKMWRKFRRRRD